MIELNSLFFVLMIEALVGLCVVLLGIFLFFRNKSALGQQAAHKLIDIYDDATGTKNRNLDNMISDHCNMDPQLQQALLSEINYNERALYQQIIQLYLNRDVELLKEIGQYINDLTEPYCKIIRHTSESASVKDTSPMEEVTEVIPIDEDKTQMLLQKNEQLEEQLSVAMNTMDEISAEYTRVFSGTQTELMLENSSKKMFDIFDGAEKSIKKLNKNKVADEL